MQKMQMITNDNKCHANSYVGAKFSSGILPPEMVHRFLGKAGQEGLAAYKEYFAQLQSDDLEHWDKVQPMVQSEYTPSYAAKYIPYNRSRKGRKGCG